MKRNADAVIISSFDISETERRTLEQLGMPVIGVNTIGLTEQRDMISIGVDEIIAMRQTVHQLAGLGHRNIAFICKQQDSNGFIWEADQRIEGFRLGMAAEGSTCRRTTSSQYRTTNLPEQRHSVACSHSPLAQPPYAASATRMPFL